MHKRIDLGREIAPVLSSRELVRELEKKIADNKVILDFKNVEFISHSFAHLNGTHASKVKVRGFSVVRSVGWWWIGT